tara:strand:+ start:190 stop:408 length:219 start_codon:yes stop_codon:yes gene_type:complete
LVLETNKIKNQKSPIQGQERHARFDFSVAFEGVRILSLLFFFYYPMRQTLFFLLLAFPCFYKNSNKLNNEIF